MKKKTLRQFKKAKKALRKAVKQATKHKTVTTSALALGGLAAFTLFDPELRSRARELAGGALHQLFSVGESTLKRDQPLLQHAS